MKAGEFIARSTYCIFARAEKKPCSNCDWKHQCKCYYVRPPSLSDWLQTSQPAVSGKAGLFPIGSAASRDPTACTNLNYQVNCCVKSFLHPLVTLRCDKHSGNILDAFSPRLHLPPSTQHPEVPERRGLVFLLTRIGKGLWARLPHPHFHLLSVLPPLCHVSVRDFSGASRRHPDRLSNCGFPESDNASDVSCWDNLCGKDVTESD